MQCFHDLLFLAFLVGGLISFVTFKKKNSEEKLGTVVMAIVPATQETEAEAEDCLLPALSSRPHLIINNI